ncbi:MAG TPA: alpha-hydroxy acid oxidase [Trueperaceae bacterium]|nr:alpha-hydroxy acid oxidase [Trueperaceae bacterium]
MPRLGPTVVSVADLRRLARRRLPRMVFDYIDGGAEDERTLRANEAAFAELTWRPRSAVVHPEVDLRTTVLGHELSLPVILAPVGSSRMFWPRGEAQAAAAAGEAGTVYTLSTLSGTRMEEVREASSGPCWYQLYLCGGREVGLEAVARAKACGYSALVVTIDTPVAGMRERDVRNGSAQLIARRFPDVVPFLPQVLVKPGWVLDFWRDGFPMDFPNILLPEGPMPYADIGAQLAAAAVSWDDVAWIAEAWDGPIVVKGVHTADDARRAVDVGASAVVVSNHGGRQLDGVAATLRVLPEVVAAVGDRVEVLLDGGVRRGGDVAKALALGARAVLVGRAYAYGLGAAGREGVAKAIDILRTELERTLKLLGCPSVHDLDASYLGPPAGWPAAPPERAAAAAR